MSLKTHDGSRPALWRGLRLVAATAAAVLLVAACGGDSDCATDAPFDGQTDVGRRCSGGTGGGTGGGAVAPTASGLTLQLKDASGAPVTSLPNNGIDKITAVATATGAGGVTLEDIPVTFSVDNDALITPDATATSKEGIVSASVGIGDNRAVRNITVTATSGSLTRSASFQVIGATLTATPLPAVITPGAAGKVDFRLVDSNSNPMGNQPIVVNGVGGVETQATTNVNGVYSYSYTAPAGGGNLDIRATAGGVSATQTVLVQSGSGLIPPAEITVQSASLAASPSVVPVNTGNTSNRSELRALFIGAGNAPVRNVRVRFDLDGDANGIGGTLSTGSDVVYSDANGVATSAYVPGSRSSPSNGGLTVRACWSANDFAAGSCPNATRATLTVVAEPLSVSISTNALIKIGPTGLDYIKEYLVQVNDAAGNAKAGVQISPSIDLVRYMKGEWVVAGDKWAKIERAVCDNEDLNRNGTLQVHANGAVEDANRTGRLEPRKADVNISFVGSSTTNADGQVVLKITYGQSLASWLDFNILVAASGIGGTEGRTTYRGVLPVLAEAITDPDKEPAFRYGPYGIQTSPVVATTTPEGQTGLLCTNSN